MKSPILLSNSLLKNKNTALEVGASLLFISLLLLTYYLYTPGFSGTFIFDDVPNLKPWSEIGDITTTTDIIRFSLSSIHFPGRPLSLACFLINDQSWPADIVSLKKTNLLLHLLNTCMCCWLLLKLLSPSLGREKAIGLALLASAIWALHPIQVSNVSYIIQRMNLLSSLATLAGLLMYISGRLHLKNSPTRALMLCSFGIVFFLSIGVLCKENGLLLCAYAILIEYYFFHINEKTPPHNWWPYWKAIFLWTPLLLFIAYTLYIYKGFTTGFEIRNFNAPERILTQGPILINYLYKLLIPHIGGSGLYFDNYPISRSLWSPINTLYSWVIILGIMTGSFMLRKTAPLLSFGIFFYFVGHSMESSALPLELYYEHRNYLPQLGIWIATASLISHLLTRSQSNKLKSIVLTGTLIFLVFISFLTRQNAFLWGEYPVQAAIWYNENPTSLRTAQEYANVLNQIPGQEKSALLILQKSAQDHPNIIAPLTSILLAQCRNEGIPPNFKNLITKASNADYEASSSSVLIEFVGFKTGPEKNPCPGFSDESLENIMLALTKNKKFPKDSKSVLFMNLGELAVSQHDLVKTIAYYDAAFAADPNPIFPYRQALYLSSAGLYSDAAPYLDLAENKLDWRKQLVLPSLAGEIQKLRKAGKQ